MNTKEMLVNMTNQKPSWLKEKWEKSRIERVKDALREIKFAIERHEDNCNILQTQTAGKDGCWANHGTISANEVDLKFENITLTLRTDGTYCFGDSSGG